MDASNIENFEYLLNNTFIDIIITYIVPDSLTVDTISSQHIAISGFRTLDFNRVKLFYPYITPQSISLKSIFVKNDESEVLISNDNDDTILPQMTMKLLDVTPDFTESFDNKRETFITRLAIDKTAYDINYHCYGNLSVESKADVTLLMMLLEYQKNIQPIGIKSVKQMKNVHFIKRIHYIQMNAEVV
jgi:hypothetical protein